MSKRISKAKILDPCIKTGSSIICIFNHGMVPNGYLYGLDTSSNLRKELNQHDISTLYYQRSFIISGSEMYETYDFKNEFKQMMKIVNQYIKTYNANHIHKIDTNRLSFLFIGHSFGGCYSHYCAKMLGNKCIGFVSLDGSDFYNCIPYFISIMSGKKVRMNSIKISKDHCIYNGIDYVGSELIPKLFYSRVYELRKDDVKNYIIIDYDSGNNEPKIYKLKSVFYRNNYMLKFGKTYRHTVHDNDLCANVIVNKVCKLLGI